MVYLFLTLFSGFLAFKHWCSSPRGISCKWNRFVYIYVAKATLNYIKNKKKIWNEQNEYYIVFILESSVFSYRHVCNLGSNVPDRNILIYRRSSFSFLLWNTWIHTGVICVVILRSFIWNWIVFLFSFSNTIVWSIENTSSSCFSMSYYIDHNVFINFCYVGN